MNKLYFKYGTMNSSKSANLLMIKHNYEENGMNVLLIKSAKDLRDGKFVKSRIGLSSPCELFEETDSIRAMGWSSYDVLMVDEAQFLTEAQVDELYQISCEIPVLCFGLLTDFQQHLFPGSKRLVELAESFEKIKTVCSCGAAANYNARFDKEGNFILDGDQVVCGNNYKPVCKNCYEKLKRYKTIRCLDKYFGCGK